MSRPFPIDPVLTAVAIAYRNKRMIADEVLPRVPVSKQAFKYRLFNLKDNFTIPNTLVGRTSKPNQAEFGFTEVGSYTKDYALDDPVPGADIANAPDGYDPVAHAAESLTNLITLGRELRVAQKVFDPDSYDVNNKATLIGTAQWSHADSNPIDAVLTALDRVIMRPNIAVLGREVWTKLRQHPRIVKAIAASGTDSGAVDRRYVADLLELDDIYVGDAWLNTANKGQTANIARAWGKHAAFLYRDSLATTASGVTFGFTAEWGGRIAGRIEDPDLGMRGGTRVRVGESTDEVICAKDLGYFFQNAVA